jgi:hypothetical protein
VPLLPDDADVPLDLEAVLDSIYNTFAYDELIDYSEPPPGPLSPARRTWIDEQLRQAGRRDV